MPTNIKPGLSFKRPTCWTKTERWQQYLHRKETEALWLDKIVHVEYWNLSFSDFLSFVSPKPTWLLVSWLKIHRCCKGWNCRKLYCANTCKGKKKKEINVHRLWIWSMQGYLFNENPLCNLLIMKIWPLSTDLIPIFPINTAPQLLHKLLKLPFVYSI